MISLNTVRRQVTHIFDKTGVANRAQAAVYAQEHGIVRSVRTDHLESFSPATE